MSNEDCREITLVLEDVFIQHVSGHAYVLITNYSLINV